MNKKRFTISLLLVMAFVALSLIEAHRTHAASVSDYKNAPGALCKTYYTSYGPPWDAPGVSQGTTTQGLSAVMGNTATGLRWVSPAYFDMPSFSSRVEVTCPIVRDNPNDPVGVTRAWIDVSVQAYANNPDPNRRAVCNIVESTDIFGSGLVEDYAGPNVVWTQNNSITRAQMVPPTAPNVSRPPTSVPINGFMNGGAAIHCTLPPDATVYSYQWKENGGNTSDW